MIISNNLPKSNFSKEKILVKCDSCNKEYERKYYLHIKSRNQFGIDICRKCSNKKQSEERKGKKISELYPKLTKFCEYCSKEFCINYAKRNTAKYCSRYCQVKAVTGHTIGNDSRRIFKCIICNTEFKSYVEHMTCSKECYAKYTSKARIGENNPNWIPREKMEKSKCPTCGTIFSYSRSNLHKGQIKLFCSLKCSKIKGGGKHIKNKEQYIIESNNYNKFIEYISNPYPKEWNNEFKDKIKKRDNYSCQLCNNSENLHIHHIDYNKQNLNEWNLLTLCQKCHNITNHNRQFWTQVFIGLNSKSKIVKKGWGFEIHFINNNEYCLKYLVFFKGKQLSLHKHLLKKELWLCTWGSFECFIKKNNNKNYFIFNQGDKIEILPGIEHQIRALTNCIITEVSTTDYPEDSIRIEKGD